MIVRPFRALRPTREMVSKIAAKPYDVVTEEQAREVAKSNPYTWYKVTRPEINFDHPVDTLDPKVHEAGKAHLRWLLDNGFMFVEDRPALYVYRQVWRDHTQTGLFATFSVDEYLSGAIKKHEHTRRDKEDERTVHFKVVGAQTGPVFLMYKSRPDLDELILSNARGEPEYDFTDESGVRHVLWVVKDEDRVSKICDAFRDVDAFYIADGHHRAAAGARAAVELRRELGGYTGEEEFNYFLAALFPHNQLKILDYNRVVRDLNGLTSDEFLSRMRTKFDVEPCDRVCKPERKHEFSVFLDGRWYKAVALPGTFDHEDAIESLDVSILQNNVLAPILGIENPRTDKRIDFVGGVHGLEELERLVTSGQFAIAFALYPTSIEDLLRVADEGKIMPPKSTWFEPKLKSGVVVHLI